MPQTRRAISGARGLTVRTRPMSSPVGYRWLMMPITFALYICAVW